MSFQMQKNIPVRRITINVIVTFQSGKKEQEIFEFSSTMTPLNDSPSDELVLEQRFLTEAISFINQNTEDLTAIRLSYGLPFLQDIPSLHEGGFGFILRNGGRYDFGPNQRGAIVRAVIGVDPLIASKTKAYSHGY